MDLKVRQLEVFKAVVETGSVTAAASRLQCTQPAVSTALAKFERASGLKLFDRARGRFTPTAEGEVLYAEVVQGMVGLDRIVATARDLREGRVGHVRIAADGAPSIFFLPQVIADFRRLHENITVEVHTRNSTEIMAWVGNRLTDIGLVELPAHWPGVVIEPFVQDCLCLMPSDHPLAKRPVVTPNDLEDESVFGVLDNHQVDTQLREAFAAHGRQLNTMVSGYYFAACRSLVREGAGVAIVDTFNAVDVGDGVVARPFEPTITYEMAVVHSAQPPPSPEVEAFLTALRSALRPYLVEEPEPMSPDLRT